jgi:hypothetical protein
VDDLVAAGAAYEEALQLDRRRLDTYGETPQALQDLVISLRKEAQVEEGLGHADAAAAARAEADALQERLS